MKIELVEETTSHSVSQVSLEKVQNYLNTLPDKVQRIFREKIQKLITEHGANTSTGYALFVFDKITHESQFFDGKEIRIVYEMFPKKLNDNPRVLDREDPVYACVELEPVGGKKASLVSPDSFFAAFMDKICNIFRAIRDFFVSSYHSYFRTAYNKEVDLERYRAPSKAGVGPYALQIA